MGPATPNHRACRTLIRIRACSRRGTAKRVNEIRFGQTSDARPAPYSNSVSATTVSVSGKSDFAARERGCKNGDVRRTPVGRDLNRSCPTWWAGRPRTAFLKNLVARWGPTNCQDNHGKQQTPDNPDGCPTRVVGRTPAMFHNTLVVGSSIRKPGKSSKTAKHRALPLVWVLLFAAGPHRVPAWPPARLEPWPQTRRTP